MGTQETILVGVDGSVESLSATSWAAARSAVNGATVHILCTFAIASYSAAALEGGYAVMNDEVLQQGAQAVVEEAVALAQEAGAAKVTSSVEQGDPSAILVEMSREVDMIVIGTRGRGGFADRLLGSVSSAVPAHAKCPVVVVPRHRSGKQFTPVERIVVGVDASDVASAALKKSVDEAELWKARLTAVSAVPLATGGSMISWLPTAVDRNALLDDVREGLSNAVATAVGDRDVKVARHALDGSPASLLIEFSTAVDLVVVGTRGRGGFAGVLLGSTSQTVLQHAICPILIVPSHKGEQSDSGVKPIGTWDRA